MSPTMSAGDGHTSSGQIVRGFGSHFSQNTVIRGRPASSSSTRRTRLHRPPCHPPQKLHATCAQCAANSARSVGVNDGCTGIGSGRRRLIEPSPRNDGARLDALAATCRPTRRIPRSDRLENTPPERDTWHRSSRRRGHPHRPPGRTRQSYRDTPPTGATEVEP